MNTAVRLQTFLYYLMLLFVGAIGVYLAIEPSSSTLDNPIAVLSAQRVLLGQLPYRDFEVLYGPLGHFFFAGGLALLPHAYPSTAFGITNAVILCGFFLIYAVKTRSLPFVEKAVTAVYLLSFVWLIGSLVSYSGLAIFLLLLSLITSNSYLRIGDSRIWQLVFATFTALTCLAALFVRLNFGIYAIASVGAGAALSVIQNPSGAKRRLIYLGFAFLLVLTLFTVILSDAQILTPFIQDMETYLRHFEHRRLPLGYALDLPRILLLPLIFAFVVALVYRACFIGLGRLEPAGVSGFVIALGLIHYSLARFDYHHVLPLFLLFPLLLQTCSTTSSRSFLFRGSYILPLLMLSIWVQVPYPIYQNAKLHFSAQPNQMVQVNGVLLQKEEGEMLGWVKKTIRRDDTLFWGGKAGSCESTFHICTNMNFYLADNRIPEGYVWYFDTVLTIFPAAQKKIVDHLREHKVRWIVLQENTASPPIPPLTSESHIFNDFVLSNYTEVITFRMPRLFLNYTFYRLEEPTT